jgi:magnesium chelatase accessory protein
MERGLDWEKLKESWPGSASSRFVEAGGHCWHVQRAGSGPGLVLIHGTGASAHSFAGLMPLLAADFDVLSMDLPGHGFTRSHQRPDTSLPGMAEAVRALLAAEGLTPVCLVGHSAGAAIAVRMATALTPPPGLVIALNGALRPLRGMLGMIGPAAARFLLINPFAVPGLARGARDPGRVRRLIEGTGSQLPDALLRPYQLLFSDRGHVRGTVSMMASWDVSGLMAPFERAGLRLHQIAGDEDRAISPDTAEDIARCYQGVSLERLPGLGHLAHEEDPGRIAEAVRTAIGRSDTAQRRAAR